MNKRSTEDFQGSETMLHDTIQWMPVFIHFSKPMECTIPRMNPYKLWICSFIDYNKHISVVQHVVTGESCAWVATGGIWETSVLSTQFCCQPETALKILY